MPDGPSAPDAIALALGLAGGLGLFLFGMNRFTQALTVLAGDRLRTVLHRLTANRFAALVSGVALTAVTQSSSVTTVLLVGFVAAGLIGLAQSIGVIMGANIGSTITAQLIAFHIEHYALALIAVGAVMTLVRRGEHLPRWGEGLVAIGLVFLGMAIMSDATRPLQTFGPFVDAMARLDDRWLAILAGALFTAIVQSSAATTGLLIVLAGQGLVSLEAAIACALGANIGTCVTALLASIGRGRPARQVALAHVLFNVLGVAVWAFLIDHLAGFARALSPASADPADAARMLPRQIANAHTLFNVLNAAVLIWFTTPFAWLVSRLAPVRVADADPGRPQYLDRALLTNPALALERVRLEIGRLGGLAHAMAARGMRAALTGSRADLEAIAAEDAADRLQAAIVEHMALIGRSASTTRQSSRFDALLIAADQFENIVDLVRTNLTGIGRHRINARVVLSMETRMRVESLAGEALRALEQSTTAVRDSDPALAARVIAQKSEIERLVHDVTEHLGRRLAADAPNRVATFRVESDLVAQAQRLFGYARHACKALVADQAPPTAPVPAPVPDLPPAAAPVDTATERQPS
ncbi:MAG: Na/Pi cotransporter family protein [Phycisphaeraceae bacterium]|nr:Na/Pi cotransporter family protein [Phycisphaeraceae bacterium]